MVGDYEGDVEVVLGEFVGDVVEGGEEGAGFGEEVPVE